MIFSLLESILLIINAIAILNEKRFLKKCTLGLFQTDSTLYRLSRTVPTKALTPSHRSSWWYSRCAPLESVKVLSCRYPHTFEHCGHFVGTRQLIFCSVLCHPFAILTRFCILSHIFKIQSSHSHSQVCVLSSFSHIIICIKSLLIYLFWVFMFEWRNIRIFIKITHWHCFEQMWFHRFPFYQSLPSCFIRRDSDLHAAVSGSSDSSILSPWAILCEDLFHDLTMFVYWL